MLRVLVLTSAILTTITLSVPFASARPMAGAEVCSAGSCNGWVIGVREESQTHTIYNGPTGGDSCNDNTVFIGFAIAGDNSMCNSSATCDACTVQLPKLTRT
jgi:hypothetical protein